MNRDEIIRDLLEYHQVRASANDFAELLTWILGDCPTVLEVYREAKRALLDHVLEGHLRPPRSKEMRRSTKGLHGLCSELLDHIAAKWAFRREEDRLIDEAEQKSEREKDVRAILYIFPSADYEHPESVSNNQGTILPTLGPPRSLAGEDAIPPPRSRPLRLRASGDPDRNPAHGPRRAGQTAHPRNLSCRG